MTSYAHVAVIIAARDAADLVPVAIRSALAQPEASEVHVVDDASTDGTAAAASACDDGSGRLQVWSLPRNGGPSAARNHALDHVSAAWFCPLDADDYFLPGRLAALVRHARDGDDIVADNILIQDLGESEPSATLWGKEQATGSLITFAEFVRANISVQGTARRELGYVKPLMATAFFRRHGLRYHTAARLGEDYLLYAEALARGAAMRLVPACGYVSVGRPGSLSRCHGTQDLLALSDADAAIAAGIRLSDADLAALLAHREHVLQRWRLRAMLDAKRDGRYGAALRLATSTFGTARYILREITREKLKA